MKIIKNILIALFIIFSHLLADCDAGYTEISGNCYYTSNLDVLVAFATNSGLSAEYEDVIGMGSQTWDGNGKLTFMGFYSGELSGSIPSDIGNLTELSQLYIFASPLSGTIPYSIGSLTNLTALYITDSQITGTIPSSIGALTNLTALDLHGNDLTGLLPNSICNLSNISSIKLSDNNLCEPYPDTCDNINTNTQTDPDDDCQCDADKLPVDGKLCYSKANLAILTSVAKDSELSDEYTDVISMGNQSWGDSKLTIWNCDNCGLKGSILSEIINLTDLTSLDLSNNALSSSIPSGISSLSLTTLDLSHNNLSGSIPTDIGSLFLTTLDLSYNALTGKTPEDICDYFVTNTSNYNFDSNLLCPPYPECSNTIYQNQLPQIDNLLVTYYRDADNDGNGDPEGACPEQFCEDYPPPTGHDCADYVIGPATDTNDACPEGQERDVCGVCGGSGLDDIYNCCPINNNGYDDGKGPNGEEPDQCGVCAGLNTDCSNGYNESTCPNMDQYCNTCFGTNQCLAQLTFYEPGSNPIDINTSTIRIHFSVPVDFLGNIATDGIEIESTNGASPTFSTTVVQDSILTLTLSNPLISNDAVTINLNSCKIKNTSSSQYPAYCIDENQNNLTDEIGSSDDEIVIPMTVRLLGDYNSDNDVDQYDLDILIENWATEDFSYELGPWDGVGAPYLQPKSFSYDGDYNIHDLMGFVQMWNWSDGLGRGIMRAVELEPTIDYFPEYYFENTKMTLNLEQFPDDIKRLWLQLDARNTNIELDNIVSSSQFDISLHGAHAEYGIYNWTLASFSQLKNKRIDLFNIINRTENNDQKLKLIYEIVGFNEKISVGELDLIYGSMPEKITINSPYPNPFNPVTTIKYSIAQKSNILIEIYNIQGRLIDKTVTDNADTGYYTYTWDGTNQPSGIYLIRMKINDTINNYRTILIK